ncbi:hypothetical protein MIND_00545600 [Mycena indigotica]|uniref:Uncharacterized protein n=1 Tax=Mycena indigotica TaxID=2126181 RepID=A0A8H6T113_9AGAR|nr:uncharacterized protein MIND_00545600 [Mycena indigotica]KAF7307510.1 hypothetical protein MIND_00545600 [Mycena indigotica]
MQIFRTLTAVLLANTAFALVPVGHTPSGKPIFNAPPGSRVQQIGRDFHLFARNGTLIHTFLHKKATRLARQSDDTSLRTSQAIVTVGPNDTIAWVNASVVVPPPAATYESQIIFVGPGLQQLDANGTAITLLQPALQYGASFAQGGPFWTAVLLIEEPPTEGFGFILTVGLDPRVNTGDRVSMAIGPDPATDLPKPFIWYQALFPSIPNLIPFELGFNPDLPPTQAVISLEEEGAFAASDYPSEPVVFENVNLTLTTGFPEVSWNTGVNGAPGVSFTVEKDGSQNARISLSFPQSS